VLGEGAEAGARLADLLHDVQQVLQRSRQLIELPDYNHIARPEVVEQAMQLRPAARTPRRSRTGS
jgi:hypothetical protein